MSVYFFLYNLYSYLVIIRQFPSTLGKWRVSVASGKHSARKGYARNFMKRFRSSCCTVSSDSWNVGKICSFTKLIEIFETHSSDKIHENEEIRTQWNCHSDVWDTCLLRKPVMNYLWCHCRELHMIWLVCFSISPLEKVTIVCGVIPACGLMWEYTAHIDGLVLDCNISIANALEIL